MNDQSPSGERHLHWRFLAFNRADVQPASVGQPQEMISWMIQVDVVGYDSEADAEIAARALVQRDTFKLQRVWECTTCGQYGRQVEAAEKIAKAL